MKTVEGALGSLNHIPCGDVFYKRQIWLYIFCILSSKTNQSYFFMYDESVAKKSQNKVISFLQFYLQNLLLQGVETLYLFADNCSSQNKNNAIIQYVYNIIYSNAFKLETVIQRYPETVHSFLPCDRCFGLIEQKKKEDRIGLKPFFKKYITNKNKAKFTIMAYRLYTKKGLFFSSFANSPAKDHFIIEKNSCKFKYPMENLLLLYYRRLNIKARKLKDVRELSAKYFEETNDTSVLSAYEY
ncbi:hypothetical protein AGLY_002202 [Aphis glycines]|uniref:DUF7869 domain-containing protein n=1 Tax=Aphis glycines TaxID=307491 RepID=A0A6G0U544_APHGL|nr:hypothetical protein AGLY_002202 [Aphis glycines]